MLRTCSSASKQIPAAAALAVATLLAACADSSTGPRSPAQTLTAPAFGKTPATTCTSRPIQPLVVTPSALTIIAGQSASFTACTQYASVYSVVSSNTAVAAVAARVTPTQAEPDEPYIASVAVTALAPGAAIITVTDKKGNQRTVAVTVVSPPGSFSYTGEVTTYRIAVGGRYTVSATGAAGGDGWLGARGGIGATAQGDFVLSAGTELTIVVGGSGTSYLHPNTSSQSGGGGGGSFVFVAPTQLGAQPMALVVGGGGGGAGQGGGSGGLTDPSGAGGGGASCCGGVAGGPGSGGLGGAGGTYTYQGLGGGGGGGGLFGAGGTGSGSGGMNSLGGGTYGSTPRFAAGVPCDFGGGLGGFGGGGAGCGLSGGGGGGYSGGGGGGGWSAGGGGSYVNTAPVAGSGVTFVAATNSLSGGSTAGDGGVTITFKGQ